MHNLLLGLLLQLLLCDAGDTRILEGHAFIVGAAVSIGGRDIKPGINVHRFANRIPLLFEVGMAWKEFQTQASLLVASVAALLRVCQYWLSTDA